jgi:hypothetical protein
MQTESLKKVQRLKGSKDQGKIKENKTARREDNP